MLKLQTPLHLQINLEWSELRPAYEFRNLGTKLQSKKVEKDSSMVLESTLSHFYQIMKTAKYIR